MKHIVLFLLLTSFSASAQKFAWAKDFVGSTDNSYGPEKIIVDKNKNIYLAGRFNGTLDFNPSPTATYTVSSVFSAGSSWHEPYLCKLDSSGNFIWVRTWPVNDLANFGDIRFENFTIDNSGNIYILGVYNKTQDFNPSTSATYTLNSSPFTVSNSNSASFILKLNSFGNFLWTASLVSAGSTTYNTGNGYMSDISVDNNNNIYFARISAASIDYIIGSSDTHISPNTQANYGAFVFKINSSGQLQYSKQYYSLLSGNSASYIIKLRVKPDNSNNLFVTGSYESGPTGSANSLSLDGDVSLGTASLGGKGFIIKYDASGTYQYAYKTIPGHVYLNFSPNNDVYLLSESPGGFAYASLSNVPSPLVPAGTNQNWNIFTLSKINNATGNLTFSKNLFAGPVFGNAQNAVPKVRFDAHGNTYISVFGTGGQGNSGLSDLIQTTYSVTLYSNPYHVVNNSGLVKVDSSGTFMLATNGFNNGYDFSVDNSQNVYFTGVCTFFNNVPDLSPDGFFNTTNGNGFVSKLAFCEAPKVSLSAPLPFCLNQQSFDYIKLSATGGPGLQYWSFQAGVNWLNTVTNTTYNRRDSSKVYSSGVYSVAVNNSCGYASKDTDNIRVQVYPLINAGASTTTTASCYGGSHGAFSINPGGGTMPYSFDMGSIPLSSVTTSSSSASVIEIPAGTYTFQVTDQNNCYHIASVTVPTVQALQISATTTAICTGNDGKIKLNSVLIDTAYTYQWSVPGQTTSSLNNLGLGVYSYTVTDSDPASPRSGCKYIGRATINPPVNTTVTTNANTTCNTPVNISGQSDLPIQYQWSPSAGVSSPNSLNTTIQTTQSQQYILTTTDGGCIKTYSVNIHVDYPSNFSYTTNSLSVTFSMSNPNYCNGNGFLWDFGNGMQNTVAPNPSVTYSTPGLYTACLKCGNVPQACVACITFSLPSTTSGGTDVSVFEYKDTFSGIKCYPNPNNGNFFIDAEKEISVIITNVLGETILKQKLQAGKTELDLTLHSDGIYFIKSENSTFKIVKQ